MAAGTVSCMPSTTVPAPRPRQSWALTAGVLILALPAIGAITVPSALSLGWPGILLPPPLILTVLHLYRATIRSTHSPQTRAVTREVGAVALALALGAGTWISALMAGVWFGVLPLFDSYVGDFPHEVAWMTWSTVLSLAFVPASWWLLRRFADDRLDERHPPS